MTRLSNVIRPAAWCAVLCAALLVGCAETKCPAHAVEQDGVCVVTQGDSLSVDGGDADGSANQTPDGSDSLAADSGMAMLDAAHDTHDASTQTDGDQDASDRDASDLEMDAATRTTDSSVEADAAVEDVDSSVITDAAVSMDAAMPDPCASADCSPFATCSVDDDQAVCTCKTGYAGDGVTCARDHCVQLDGSPTCGPNTECTPAGGSSVSCACADDYADCVVGAGCETSLATSSDHCGACDYACAGSLKCTAGLCEQKVARLVAGDENTCAFMERSSTDPAGHAVKCWGRNTMIDLDLRLLGDAEFMSVYDAMPRAVPNLRVRDLATGPFHACAIDADSDEMYCWGDNAYRQLGTAIGVAPGNRYKRVIAGVTKVAVGRRHTCAIVSGAVKCWGANDKAQLGLGTTGSPQASPQAVLGITGNVVDLAASGLTTCALTEAGSVYCWPYYDKIRQLDDSASGMPLSDGVQLSMQTFSNEGGDNFLGCVLRKNGAVGCWGRHNDEIPGIGVGPEGPFWVNTLKVPADVVRVVSGAFHVCMLTAPGQVYCLGSHSATGVLGLPVPTTPYDEPTLLPGIEDAVELVGGSFHNCIRRASGQVQCFGRNAKGELGNGSTLTSYMRVNVVGLP